MPLFLKGSTILTQVVCEHVSDEAHESAHKNTSISVQNALQMSHRAHLYGQCLNHTEVKATNTYITQLKAGAQTVDDILCQVGMV